MAQVQATSATPLHDAGNAEVRKSSDDLWIVRCDCGASTILAASTREELRRQLELLAGHERGSFPKLQGRA